MMIEKNSLKNFIKITLLTSVWVDVSGVFRYFIFVMPRIKHLFENKKGVRDMNLNIFAIWSLWTALLRGIFIQEFLVIQIDQF